MNTSAAPVHSAPQLAAKSAAEAATAAMRNDMLEDTTDWNELCRPANEPTLISIQHQPPHVRSLVFLLALRNLGAAAYSRGPEFPFAFKTCSTNGMLTALRTCLATHAAQLYIDGADPHQCMLTCPATTPARAYLGIICAASTIGLSESPGRILDTARAAAALGCASKNQNVADAALATYRTAYATSDFAGKYSISASLKADIRNACLAGESSSHVGQLILKKLEYECKVEASRQESNQQDPEELWQAAQQAVASAGVSMENLRFE